MLHSFVLISDFYLYDSIKINIIYNHNFGNFSHLRTTKVLNCTSIKKLQFELHDFLQFSFWVGKRVSAWFLFQAARIFEYFVSAII